MLDLRDVFTGKVKRLPVECEPDLSDYEVNGVYPISSAVSFRGEVVNAADVVSLRGTATLSYTAPCDRCTEQTTKKLDIEVSHIIVPSLSNEDEEEFIVAENMKLNLADVLRTDIILSLPFVFLCSDDCKGICAQCGQNLNNGQCVCEKEISRFE